MFAPSSRSVRVLTALVLLVLVAGGVRTPLGMSIAPRVAWAATRTVTNAADSGAGSLRQTLASAGAGDTITFNLPTSSTITLSSTLGITKPLTIDGSAVPGLAVSGDNAVGVFTTTAPLTLMGLTITKGRTSGEGAGLRATSALTLTNVKFFDNTANLGGGAAVLGTLTMSDTQFISNTATLHGAGLYLSSASINSVLRGGLFEDNSASGEGGGLFVAAATGVHLEASRLFGNHAGVGGGGIYLSGSRVQVDNNIMAGNSSAGAADIGIGSPPASVAARHNTFVAATAGQGVAISAGESLNDTVVLTNTIFGDYGTALRTGPNAATVTANGVLWSNVTTQTQRIAGSITLTNTYTGTADFVNPGALDYHLRRASAAINKGVPTDLTSDIDGQTRPAGSAPDLGADEFVNIAPTISDIADQTTTAGVAVGPINFTVGDANTDALTVTVSSSNTALVPNANIVVGGSGANRTLTITPLPGQTGTTTITITLSDGETQVSDSFVLTVNSYKNYLPIVTR
jgi:Right handed beta helix region